MRDIFSDLSAPVLSDADPVRRAQIQMKQPLAKRFYKDVTVSETENGYAILLDGRPIKTPGKRQLAVPTREAAEMLAREWDAQAEEINPTSMPLTRLANTAIDGIEPDMDAVFDDIVKFAGTDLVCYRADAPESLVAFQAELWDPIVYWAAEAIGARFILAQGIIHREQPREAIAAYASKLDRHRSALKLAALHTVTTLTGSALIALAFAEGRLTAEEAWKAAHADEDWNIRLWGTDAEAEARRRARWTEMKAATDMFGAISAA
ncbi:ATPase [Rhizobium sp. KVB221]|uniref:ATPase n=1 Tax=Rhizobium setariae TaxID=2801340 RepID=A0A936YLU3_9HYPH|nr:ATP12 family protein [Rhizobium setariae]MBL0372733.1 ATPase [Rhizobium setariae]